MLFDPLTLRSVTFPNRIFVSPMCQYSSVDGVPNDWHFIHLGSRAVGGAGLVMVEASAVSPEGRITAWDSGIWSREQADAFRRIVDFVEARGSVSGIQLAHAGRKASTEVPWRGGRVIRDGPHSWQPLAPSAIAFRDGDPSPRAMTRHDIDVVVEQFDRSTQLAVDAGFRAIELHFAHGYLMHEFLSPLTNQRDDDFGGSLANRMRLPLHVAETVRRRLPESLPLFVRISATDWAEGGWDIVQSIEFCKRLGERGVDLIDCSSGGAVPHAKVEIGPGYQVPFARAIRHDVGIATGAVGLITEARQAEEIVANGSADAVLLARAFLRDPYWPRHAAKTLGVEVAWPEQYARAE